MSSLLQAELAATCNAIGFLDPKTQEYYIDENTLEAVKDIIRYLRRDDENHEMRRYFGETNVLCTDLLPLLKNHSDKKELFDVVLRLVVNLTTPPLILWNEGVPTEKNARNYFLKIEDHLQIYKQAFADEKIWSVLYTKLTSVLDLDFAERGEENSLIIERILILIRNVLYISYDPDRECRPDNDANVHDQVIWALHQSRIMDVILYMVCSTEEKLYHIHVIEVLYFMFKEQNPSELAQAALQRSQTEKTRDEAELLAIRHRETVERQQKLKKYTGARHSRFGGTYVINSMKSINDENNLIYHKPLNHLKDLNFDAGKVKPKTPKNRLPIRDVMHEHRSAFSIRLLLKEFCVEFLNGAYNTVMYSIKNILARSKSQEHDESYYLWALRFFMEFNRSYKFDIKFVSETMSLQIFHFVQQQIENHLDMMATDKAKIRQWSRRLHLALKAYKELLLTLMAMDASSDGSVRDSSSVIKSNIFYVVEYRELILTLLVSYDELKMSHSYLNDLLETQHVFLKMLEKFCSKQGNLMVQEKKRKIRKKKKSKKNEETGAPVPVPRPEMNLESLWNEVLPQLSHILEGSPQIPSDIVLFDASSEVPIEQQKTEAMKKIQLELRKGNVELAVSMFRTSRELWPEDNCFGEPDITPEDEFLALGDVFFADIGNPVDPNAEQSAEKPQESIDEDEELEEDENKSTMPVSETNLCFSDFVKRLAHTKVVQACAKVLKNFEKNSTNVNHCVAKLLHRIAWDCKMYAMIYQLSIFVTFQKIFQAKDMPQFAELVKFATFIMKKFFETAKKNKMVFIEVLFWKNSREAFDLEEGYSSYGEQSSAAQKAWTELEEDELRRLFMEHQEKQIDEDVVDWIQKNLINATRTRRGILKKLKELYLLTDYKPRKGKSKVNKKKDVDNMEKEDGHSGSENEETGHESHKSSSASPSSSDNDDEGAIDSQIDERGEGEAGPSGLKTLNKSKAIQNIENEDDANNTLKKIKSIKKVRKNKNISLMGKEKGDDENEVVELEQKKMKPRKKSVKNKSKKSFIKAPGGSKKEERSDDNTSEDEESNKKGFDAKSDVRSDLLRRRIRTLDSDSEGEKIPEDVNEEVEIESSNKQHRRLLLSDSDEDQSPKDKSRSNNINNQSDGSKVRILDSDSDDGDQRSENSSTKARTLDSDSDDGNQNPENAKKDDENRTMNESPKDEERNKGNNLTLTKARILDSDSDNENPNPENAKSDDEIGPNGQGPKDEERNEGNKFTLTKTRILDSDSDNDNPNPENAKPDDEDNIENVDTPNMSRNHGNKIHEAAIEESLKKRTRTRDSNSSNDDDGGNVIKKYKGLNHSVIDDKNGTSVNISSEAQNSEEEEEFIEAQVQAKKKKVMVLSSNYSD